MLNLFGKQVFTITIGDYSTAVLLHDAGEVKKRLIVSSLDDENKPKLEKLFNNYKFAPVYILLDTVDQNYKRKIYPSVNIFDLHTLVKRDQKKESDYHESAIENYLIFKDKENKKWECIFVSSARTGEIEAWKEFALQMPNRLIGIYMLPLESYILLKRIARKIKTEKKSSKKKTSISSFITQNKVSGTRQIVFLNNMIIFTRVVNYDFSDKRFAERFAQDIFRTNEYLKRIFPNIKIEDINFINILPQDIIDKIEANKDSDLKFYNLTPYQAAVTAKCSGLVSKNSNFADILIAHTFARARAKILKFTTPKIKSLQKLYIASRLLFIVNVILPLAIAGSATHLVFYNKSIESQMTQLMQKKLSTEKSYKKIKSSILSEEEIANLPIDKIMDFGKINEALINNEIDIFAIFNKLKLIKKHEVIANNFSYRIVDYDPKAQQFPIPKIAFSVFGTINIKSGDINELFQKFDGLVSDTKKTFEDYKSDYSDLPRDLDFSKKYYSFPISLKIESR